MADKTDDDADRGDTGETASSAEREETTLTEGINDDSSERSTPAEADPSRTSGSTIGLGEAQDRATEAAKELIEHDFEGMIKAEAATEGGWRTVVEFVERSAVPDTQDIIGRYEIMLDPTGSVTGYELLERYRRGDMKEEM